MWVFSKYGFFSIVQKKRGEFQIRSRLVSHLEALKKRCNVRGLIVRSPNNDYRWRIVVSSLTWKRIAPILAQEIDYANFKSEVARVDGYGDYERALHAVWRVMHDLQEKQERPASRTKPKPKFEPWPIPDTASDFGEIPF